MSQKRARLVDPETHDISGPPESADCRQESTDCFTIRAFYQRLPAPSPTLPHFKEDANSRDSTGSSVNLEDLLEGRIRTWKTPTSGNQDVENEESDTANGTKQHTVLSDPECFDFVIDSDSNCSSTTLRQIERNISSLESPSSKKSSTKKRIFTTSPTKRRQVRSKFNLFSGKKSNTPRAITKRRRVPLKFQLAGSMDAAKRPISPLSNNESRVISTACEATEKRVDKDSHKNSVEGNDSPTKSLAVTSSMNDPHYLRDKETIENLVKETDLQNGLKVQSVGGRAVTICLEDCTEIDSGRVVTPSSGAESDVIVCSTQEGVLAIERDQQCEEKQKPNEEKAVICHDGRKAFPIFNTPKRSPKSSLKLNKKSPENNGCRRTFKSQDDNEQLLLDFGQTANRECPQCGMFYHIGPAEEESAHNKFHNRLQTALRFPGWKKERIFQEFDDGSRIVSIRGDDPKYALKKVEDILSLVDRDLGFRDPDRNSASSNQQAYLYVSIDKQVCGVCVVEPISQAYRLISESASCLGDAGCAASPKDRRCSEHAVAAKCGVSRIWVYKESRRQGVATKLVDCVRSTFLYGSLLTMANLAFSDPTSDGLHFARRYTGADDFLVYKYNA